MHEVSRWFWVGSRDEVRAELARALGGLPVAADVDTATEEDLVIVDAQAAPPVTAALTGGHVFAGVRALKQVARRPVFVVVDEDDRIGPQLARFCLADGVIRWHPTTGSLDLGELRHGGGRGGSSRRPSVNDLLERIEGEFAAGGGQDSVMQRLLRFEGDDSLLSKLQDSETGLFDGPYATWKLDEEWKRALRFHEPLSLILLDLGDGLERLADPDRRAVLVDAASVFLNECRDIDVLARFAPTTFLFLLPGTGTDGAEFLAKRMIAALRERLPADAGLLLAAGVATAPSSHIPDRKAFLMIAEACLRRAQADDGGGQVSSSWQ